MIAPRVTFKTICTVNEITYVDVLDEEYNVLEYSMELTAAQSRYSSQLRR